MDKTILHGATVPSVVQTLKPKSEDWIEVEPPTAAAQMAITVTAWFHKEGFFCISAVEYVLPEGETESRPEYHLSMSRQSAIIGASRVTSNQAAWILKEFGMDGAFEDNHVPFGKVRNFWRPVNDNLVGQVCACVDDEPAIKEDKGDYIWRPA